MGVEGGIPSRRQAHVFQINLSPGGVPKEAVPQARLGFLGFEGDGHNDSELHGGPERAVCLYSLEHFLALQREGHPIYPGAIGENLTISGLDWPQLTPGMRLGIGDETATDLARAHQAMVDTDVLPLADRLVYRLCFSISIIKSRSVRSSRS